MNDEEIIELLNLKTKINKQTIEKSIKIIKDNESVLQDDIFLANKIAANMEITPREAVEISMNYNKIKNSSYLDAKSKVLEETKPKNKPKLIIGITTIILISLIIFILTSTLT